MFSRNAAIYSLSTLFILFFFIISYSQTPTITPTPTPEGSWEELDNSATGGGISNNTTRSTAPDFALDDFQGRTVRLIDYRGEKHVVLVLNRGFM